MFEWIGWIATAVFAFSYFCSEPRRLRLIQAFAALLWISYGVIIGALPIIVANIVVAGLAIGSTIMPVRLNAEAPGKSGGN